MQHGVPLRCLAHSAFLLIGLIAVAFDCVGQQIVWRTNYHGNGTGTAIHDRAAAMALDPAGNMYVTGESGTTNRNYGVATLKYDPMGRLEWEARYSSTTNIAYVDTPVQILVDPSTNVFVLGYSWKEGALLDTFVLKYGRNGALLWERHRGPPYTYPSPIGHMLWNSNGIGHLVVTGTAPSTNGLPVIRTTQYDAEGQEVWTTESQGNDPIHFAERLRIDAVSSISVMGQSSNNFIRLFYDESGNLLSNVVFRLRPDFGVFARLPTDDGGIAVAGYHACGGWAAGRYGPDGSEHRLSAYKVRWSDAGYNLSAYALDERGNFYVAGNLCNYGFCQEGQNYDLIVLKYDSNGRRIWGNTFRMEPFVSVDFLRPVVINFDSDGNVYVGTMAYIVKYDSNGNRLWYVLTSGQLTGGERMANIEIGPGGDIFMAGTQYGVGTGEDFLIARWRQPVTTNLAVLTTPLVSQSIPTNTTVYLQPIVIQPQPLGSNWLRWGDFVSSRWLSSTNPRAAEYSLQITSAGGTAYSGWMRVSYLPQLTNLTLLPEGQISFSIVGETHVYTIEGSTDLVHWQPVTNIFYCGTSPITNVVALAGSRFFRASRSD